MIVSLIVAMGENNVIGVNGAMPWRLSADLIRFRRITMGHPLVMGRKTCDSIGRLLPGRQTIIISRNRELKIDGATVVGSLPEALRAVGDCDEVFVAGGGEIYRLAMPLANRIYLTRVAADLPGDTTFPRFEESEWTLISREFHPADEKNDHPMTFEIRERIAGAGAMP